MYIAKDTKDPYRDGTVEYTNRLSGRRYIVEPSNEGYLVSSAGVLIYTCSEDRADAMRLIELLERNPISKEEGEACLR